MTLTLYRVISVLSKMLVDMGIRSMRYPDEPHLIQGHVSVNHEARRTTPSSIPLVVRSRARRGDIPKKHLKLTLEILQKLVVNIRTTPGFLQSVLSQKN